jgi:hypothetical protein
LLTDYYSFMYPCSMQIFSTLARCNIYVIKQSWVGKLMLRALIIGLLSNNHNIVLCAAVIHPFAEHISYHISFYLQYQRWPLSSLIELLLLSWLDMLLTLILWITWVIATLRLFLSGFLISSHLSSISCTPPRKYLQS